MRASYRVGRSGSGSGGLRVETEKVGLEGRGVTEGLKGCIHEASVAEVTKARVATHHRMRGTAGKRRAQGACVDD